MKIYYGDDSTLLVKMCVVNFIGRRQHQPLQVDVSLLQRLGPAGVSIPYERGTHVASKPAD